MDVIRQETLLVVGFKKRTLLPLFYFCPLNFVIHLAVWPLILERGGLKPFLFLFFSRQHLLNSNQLIKS